MPTAAELEIGTAAALPVLPARPGFDEFLRKTLTSVLEQRASTFNVGESRTPTDSMMWRTVTRRLWEEVDRLHGEVKLLRRAAVEVEEARKPGRPKKID
jgi:hypothetical protein